MTPPDPAWRDVKALIEERIEEHRNALERGGDVDGLRGEIRALREVLAMPQRIHSANAARFAPVPY